jgi:outer membrane protein insertion porin family
VLAAVAPRAAWAQSPQPPIIVREIAIEGNRRVQEAVIRGRIQTTIGSEFVPARLGEDLRAIFGLGFFDDVQLKVESFEGGVKVTFVVTERPYVREVEVVGNKKIDTNTLLEKIDLKLGAVYNPVEVQKARERAKEYYEEEGYFEVKITTETSKFGEGDVRVTFRITEGRRITIDSIVIKGNAGLTAKQIKAVMATREREYFILRGTVQRQKLEEDIERILQLYADHGYVQARVESHDVAVDRARARATITIVVVEGPQFKVGTVTITGVSAVPLSEVQRQVLLKPGGIFSRDKLRLSVESITRLYSTIGRASVNVEPDVVQDTQARVVNVTLQINEGPDVFVERINISGNSRSQEKVLRREIPFAEGDLFTITKLDRARQRLNNLGFFETVRVSTAPGSDRSKIVVNIEVVEKPTGQFSIGGGFSSVDNLVGTIDLSERNFLGRGWEVSLKFRGGADVLLGSLSFTEPWLFDRPLAAGFDLYDTQRNYDEYEYDSLGGDVRLSHPFLDYARWFLTYRLSRDTISDLTGEAAITLADEEGTTLTSAISGVVSRDTRDNVFNPSRGSYATLGTNVAGLGGDNKYVKFSGTLANFFPVWLGHIVATRLEGGYVFSYGGAEIPLFERYFGGGPNSIRSFKFHTLSPEENGVLIGGTSLVLGSAEYIVPLPFNLRAVGFVDVGNVYGFTVPFDLTDLQVAVGGGIRWNSPFGPIKVDYGINVTPRPGDEFGAFQFSVGSTF